MSGHVCTRTTKSAKKGNKLNVLPRVYLNCGCWQAGRTDFALVCEDEIVVCSWGNFVGEQDAGIEVHTKQKTRVVTNPKAAKKKIRVGQIKKLLKKCGKRDRGHVLAYYRAPSGFKFTASDDLFVFIGDCHIHLLHLWYCDNFIKPHILHDPKDKSEHGYYHRRESLAQEFERFVKICKEFVQTPNLVQIGDLFEVWEVQGLYERALEVVQESVSPGGSKRDWLKKPCYGLKDQKKYDASLKEAKAQKDDLRKLYPKHASSFESPVAMALADYFDLFNNFASAKEAVNLRRAADKFRNKVCPRDVMAILDWRFGFAAKAWPRSADSSLDMGDSDMLSRIVDGDQPLDVVHAGDIVRAIKRQYEHYYGISNSFWDGIGSIEGNHDTTEWNNYVDKRFSLTWDSDSRDEFEEWIVKDDPFALLDDPKLSYLVGPTNKCGAKSQICYEHGHAFDAYNNDMNYFNYAGVGDALDRGVVNAFGAAGYHKTRDWVVDEMQNPTSWWQRVKGWASENQLMEYALERVQAINRQNPEVRLVVFGHTHVAQLFDWGV